MHESRNVSLQPEMLAKPLSSIFRCVWCFLHPRIILSYVSTVFPYATSIFTIHQLMENEEIIGTLIESNDRIVTVLSMYNELVSPATNNGGDAVQVRTDENEPPENENTFADPDQEASARKENVRVHPDLEDLNPSSFGPLEGMSFLNEQKCVWIILSFAGRLKLV
jgi:hypothetical protein